MTRHVRKLQSLSRKRQRKIAMLQLSTFFVKEHVGMFKMHDVYDILDPSTQQMVGQAHEIVSGFKKLLRLFIDKKLMSTTVEVRDAQEQLVFSIHRPFRFFRSEVQVLDGQGTKIGYFKSKIFTVGGGFWVYDAKDQQIAEVKGDWVGWNFRFLTPSGEEIGQVTKKWAGIAREFFTSADNYVVSISDDLSDEPTAKCLLLAAALAIDIVYKEGKN
jgi:uncharacterized protein YxjI